MPTIKPTRMELLLVKKKLSLAKKGHKLLKQKRDVLVIEFFNTLKHVKQLRGDMGQKFMSAQKSLSRAEAIDGEVNIERVAVGLAGGATVEFGSKSIMGVNVPVIKNIATDYQWPGYLDQSLEFDNAVKQYREMFPSFIRLMEKQLTLRYLANEIQKVKRRVNSLEYLTVPRLEHIQKMIAFKLEELEKENFSRLKQIKKRQNES